MENYPVSLRTEIVARFMSKRELEGLMEQYEAAKMVSHSVSREIPALHFEWLDKRIAGTPVSLIAKEYGVKYQTCMNAVKTAALHRLECPEAR